MSLALLKLLPAPNTNIATSTTAPTNNFSINLPFQKTTTRYDVKIDYQITPKDHLSGRYNKDDIKIFQAPAFGAAGGGSAQGAFAGTGTQNTYSTGINYDHAFSGTLLTEARIGVANYGNSAIPTGYGTNYAEQIGIPGVNISQFTSGQVGILMQDFTNSTTTPFIGYSASLPWIRAETNIDGINHWTRIIRNHTIKFGAIFGEFMTICFRTRPSVRAERSPSGKIIPLSQVRKRMSPMRWPAFFWMSPSR